MLSQIVIEAEAHGNSQTMLRLSIDKHLMAENLTAPQAQLLVGEILDRIPVAEVTLDAQEREQDRRLAAIDLDIAAGRKQMTPKSGQHFGEQAGRGAGARSGLRGERVMTSATIEAGERKTRTKAVTHFTKATVVVELLRAQHGEANARKIALKEQRNARRARSRRRFEFWGRVAMLLG